ncbi:GLABROUS1 enhancer-binding protein family [Dillenia turbinata]|uniref:GLABROUS1 enhancer-binding protein family n=1 Tax=Dillenia turbinata TaxID=194707 RepID=A0AAN8U9P5_9MAGN
MASQEDQNTFNEQSLDDDDDSEEDHHQNEVVVDDDDLEEEDEIDIDDDDDIEEEDVVTFTTPPNTVTVALPAIPNGVASVSSDVVSDPPPPLLPRPMLVVGGSSSTPDPSGRKTEERKPLPLADESRRLFQRLWTDEDEIELLQGFFNYTTQRGTQNSSHHHDTSLFYDQIRGKLQLDFNKNQLVEKLRRLKKKYRNVLNRISSGKELAFKTPHDQATFEISRKIWSGIGGKIEENALEDDDPNPNPSPNPNITDHNNNGVSSVDLSEKKVSRKRSRPKLAEKMPAAAVNSPTPISASIPSMIEDTVRSCLSPLFKELINNAVSGPCGSRGLGVGLGFGGGMTLNPMPLNFGPSINFSSNEAVDEKWRKQQILELEVYSKRLELVQDQIKNALEELRSMGKWNESIGKQGNEFHLNLNNSLIAQKGGAPLNTPRALHVLCMVSRDLIGFVSDDLWCPIKRQVPVGTSTNMHLGVINGCMMEQINWVEGLDSLVRSLRMVESIRAELHYWATLRVEPMFKIVSPCKSSSELLDNTLE